MHAALDWSHDLLSPAEQTVLLTKSPGRSTKVVRIPELGCQGEVGYCRLAKDVVQAAIETSHI
jgi:hypothetical protein